MPAPLINSPAIIKWLGQARYKRLGEDRAQVIREVIKRAPPDVPTAALWTLQGCSIMPTQADTDRWQKETAPVNPPSTDA